MKKVISALLAISLVLVQALALSSCQKQNKYTEYYFEYFDTVTSIVGYASSQEEFDSVCESIKQQLANYHKMFTIYERYSDFNNLTTINDLKDGKHSVVTVDAEIIKMLQFCKDMYVKTNGKVNVAMGSVLSIWHNYRNQGLDEPSSAQLPPMQSLQQASMHTDINDVIIDEQNSTVYLADPEMTLDVGAIAKGYVAEMLAQNLIAQGVTDYILNLGGNIRTIGLSDGSPWKVGIENPDTENEQTPYIEYLGLSGQSVVTSGVYQRYYVVNGQSYHHLIDPATLMPGTNYMSVSIVTDNSALGDALSTALFLMSYEEGLELINSTPNAEAMWVFTNGEQKYSDGFKDYTIDYDLKNN